MSMSISDTEAGLLAAPWEAAQQDPALLAAARQSFAQTADLAQRGKKDHPTDRIVLWDTAATLELELAAEPDASRQGSLTRTVILPGSGDTFSITVDTGGHASFKSEHDGRAGVTSEPGGAAVLGQYTALLGQAPSQDELAGFLAARVAGGALPAAATGAPAPTLTVTSSTGTTLATGTASALLAEWSVLVVMNNGETPILDLPDNPPLANATEAAACLLGLAIRQGAVSAGLVAGYNQTVSWLDEIDQPMLQVAAHYEQLAAYDAGQGNQGRVRLDDTAAKLALQIASEPEGQRGCLSTQVHVDGHQTEVTVSQTTTDVTGGAQFHDIDNSSLFSLIEQVGTVVLDVASVFVPVLAPVAVAVNAAEAGEDFAEGNVLGGALTLGSAAGMGLGALGAAGETAGLSTSEASSLTGAGQLTLEGDALAGGVSGTVQAAERGDGLGIAAGLLQAAAAGASGEATLDGNDTIAGKGLISGLSLAATAASVGDGIRNGGLMGGLLAGLGPLLTATASAVQAADQDPVRQAQVQQSAAAIRDDAAATAAAQADVPADWQSAAVVPVQQQELPAPGVAAGAGDPFSGAGTEIDGGFAGSQAMTQGMDQALGGIGNDAPQAAAQYPVAVSTPASYTIDTPYVGMTVHYTDAVNGDSTGVIAGLATDGTGVELTNGGFVGSALITRLDATTPPVSASSGAPMLMTGTMVATAGGSGSGAGILTTAGEFAEGAVGLAARGAVAAGEGFLAAAALPAAVLAGIFWPTSMGSDDTLTGQTASGDAPAVQNNTPDGNAPPPPAVSGPLAYTAPIPAGALPVVAASAVTTAQADSSCKLLFVPETLATTTLAQQVGQAYQAQGPNGGLVDTRTQSPIVPALAYSNPNPAGAPYVKFDNFQMLPNGGVEVIDSKTALPAASTSSGGYWVAQSLQTQLRTQSEALMQNPGCFGTLQVPNAAQATLAAGVLQQLGIENMSVMVRPHQ